MADDTIDEPCFAIRADGTFHPRSRDRTVGDSIDIFNEGDNEVFVYVYDWDTKKPTEELFGVQKVPIPARGSHEELVARVTGTFGLTTTPLAERDPVGPNDGKINVGGGGEG